MPIDREYLTTQLQGVEKAEEKIAAILSEYDKEKISILKNKDDILSEKNAFEKKAKENELKIAELEKAKAELDESIKSGLPDKEKKVFEADIKTLKDRIEILTNDNAKMKSEYDTNIKTLSDEKKHYIVGEEFSKLINANTAIFPALKNGLIKRFFADYPKTFFGPFEYNGNVEYVVEGEGPNKGKKMGDLLNEFLNSEEGKYYLENKNNGGGAIGASSKSNQSGAGMSRKDFDAMSYEAQDTYMKNKGLVHD
jgi:hypothetical protein